MSSGTGDLCCSVGAVLGMYHIAYRLAQNLLGKKGTINLRLGIKILF